MDEPVRSICALCGWESRDGVPRDIAQAYAVVHVIKKHPEAYTASTNKVVPELTAAQEYYLEMFTGVRGRV